ncbi:MAG: dipeptide epimerase [Defluviitaleaceae bacterium]|nr:dipeptide epimerase [Defluviitaleaceae bacterium]
MKITKIELKEIDVPLKRPFVTFLRSVNSVQSLLVKITTDTGHTGYGEVPSTALVTGDSKEAQAAVITNYIAPKLIGCDIAHLEIIMEALHTSILHNYSAKAGIDVAVHDLYGKLYNAPLYKILGGHKSSFMTDITVSIGSLQQMVKESIEHVQNGYTTLKLKVGTGEFEDVGLIKEISRIIGPGISLRIDANQGWNGKEAVRIIRKLEDALINIEFIEQPVPATDFTGMAFVTQNVYTPIVADESVFSPKDALNLLQIGGADIINIKLMKTGGFYNALQICNIAQAHGKKCMIGCMLESNLGSTAAAHLAGGKSIISIVDLDSANLCAEDAIKGGAVFDGSTIHLTESPGLGVEG